MRELILLEEFKNCIPERTVVYLNEQKATTLQQAVSLADEFALTHRTVFTKRDAPSSFIHLKQGDAPVARAPVPLKVVKLRSYVSTSTDRGMWLLIVRC